MKMAVDFRKNIQAMAGYVPGEQPKMPNLIKLNTNENPYPPSPAAEQALKKFDFRRLRLYPDPVGQTLREEIAAYHGLTPDSVICTNGSDDVLTIVSRAFLDETHPLAAPDPTYSLYKSLTELQNAPFLRIPLKEDDFSFPDDFEEKAAGANLIIIARPNAPTGTLFPKARMEALCRNFSGCVMIDEAYADFAEDNCADLVRKYPNLIVSRTFSKSRSLAGLRFGYALASPEIITELMKVKDSYNVNAVTQAVALAAFRDTEYLRQTVKKVVAGREKLSEDLKKLGFRVADSQTNFVFASPADRNGEAYFRFLRSRAIIVRYFPGPVTGAYVRITVGTPEEMSSLIAATRDYLQK